MANISVEQKLTMLNQLRSRYDNNQADLLRREQILYGRMSPVQSADVGINWSTENEVCADTLSVRGTFRLRLLIAAVLAVLLILSDQKGKDFLGVSTSQIYTMIEEDYMTQMEEILNDAKETKQHITSS
ncbi:MAG: hypothetical protein IKV27_07055 [Lachnospiraceae bacterium]|nr:hypothetical protein [Lachnospiraceae bacterium]